MSDTHDEDGHRTKRFKYQSYNEQLKDVHAPSALERSKVEEALEDEECLFHGALSHWMQLNLSPSFISFARKSLPLSQSLALLVHSWREVTDLWIDCVRSSDDEAKKALFDLFQKLVEDLRTIITPAYEDIISCLLELLPRRLEPEILSALLVSLTAAFKHVLVPAVSSAENSDILSATWNRLRETLTKCNPEVQRAVSEVWSSLLRRLKKDERERCVRLMLDSAHDSGDFIAWSFVFTAKSVAQTIHTSGPPLIMTCLDYHLTASEADLDATSRLTRRVLTALVHHCSKPEQFSPVVDPIIARLGSLTEIEDIRRTINVLAVPCSVRQGSRLTAKQLSTILDSITKMSYSEMLRLPFLSIITAALCATSADLSVWMGAGRRAIEHAWSVDETLAVLLTGTLLKVGWKGFTQFALPPFLKTSSGLLANLESSAHVETLRVLSKLAKSNMLKSVEDSWRSSLTKMIRVWFEQFVISEESVIPLVEILTLLPILSPHDLIRPLVHIAEDLVTRKADRPSYPESWANETFVFGLLVRVLAKSKQSSLPAGFDAIRLIHDAIKRWYWSEYVMEGIAELAKSCQYSGSEPIPDQENIVERLTNNLKSHSHIIRCSSLELLNLPWIFSSSNTDGIKRCLAAELAPLSVQGVRERVLLTGRVGQVALDDDRIARVCITWLLGQLKVGLRPVWAPAAQAFASISGRSPDTLWSMMIEELRSLDVSSESTTLPPWMTDGADEEDEVIEEERSWRDPSAHKFRVTLSHWTSNDVCKNQIIEEQKPHDRFDARSYEAQLLVTLGEFPSLAEKHSRELVPLFLSFASPSSATEKASRINLTNWLKLFAKFTNPRAFYLSNDVHNLYVSLLSHPDRSLQSTALSCLQTYKSPALTRKADTLTNLLDDTKWRDELAMLDLHELMPDERTEIVPVLIRLFYGMMLERGGRGKGTDRRSALLGALGACTDDELVLLVDLMLEPFSREVNFDLSDDNERPWELGSEAPLTATEKQQIGFLMFLADVLRILGTRFVKSWPRLVALTLTLTAHAQQELQGLSQDGEETAEENEEEKDDEKNLDKSTQSLTRSRQFRLIRQLGLKRITEFFRIPTDFNFTPYRSELFRAVISPRIGLLDRENTQAPSALLELLFVWSLRPDTAMYLVKYDQRTLTKIFDCLVATNVKPTVQIKIFDLLERLLVFASEDDSFSEMVVRPYTSSALNNIALAIQRSTGGGSASSVGFVAQREIAILSKLSPYISDGTQAATLLSIFLPQLRRTGKGIPEKSKIDMLDILCNLIPQIPNFMQNNGPLFVKTLETLSYLFQLLRGRQARVSLVNAFKALSGIDSSLLPTANLLLSLNSYSVKRIDEPDFDRRLAAFAALNEERWKMISTKEWSPILHNMLYFIQDEEELSIRSNAALSFKRFLDALSANQDPDMQSCFVRVLFPGLKRCLRAKSDLVRAEVMSVLAYAVEKCENVNALQEMRVLLAAGDEEASFFNNIFHIQVHRRNRALRRLADFCDEPGFRSSTLQEIFVPVVNSFIAGSGTADHHLVNEAITTLGRIARHLVWPAYFSLVQLYIRLATEKNAAERAYTRALVSILDNFHFSMEDMFTEEAEEEADGDNAEQTQMNVPFVSTKIHDAVNNQLLPTLLKHLEQRDELEDINRIPLAIGIARVSLHLPEASRDVQIPRLLTILSQIFRSKSQETRDVSRETLCRIAAMLGSPYLPTIIRQLREALTRGPHLHVLAFVTHALLVHITLPENATKFENLDNCVPDVVHVSSEVVIGQSGKDVESEGFKTKMKEVRGSKSKGMDSFAILAKHITPAATSNLLLPIKAIMQETESAKTMSVVDDVLRRMSVGLNGNTHFALPELLMFCHTLISQNARFFQENVKVQKRRRKKVNDAEVQLKRRIEPEDNHYSHNSWRFVTFGLDLFNTAFRRGRFDFSNANIITRLEPMVNVIGNTLYAKNGNVMSSGLKATAQIVKAPLKNVEKSLPIFVRQTLQIIRETGNTEADVVQAAFKALTVIIRDCSSSQVKEKDLAFLLELLTPDLEEVDRQANAFALLRAIVSRKFVVPEIYDLMNRVGEIMVTSQSSQVQELCRGVLLQFLLDYPQGKNRLKQQFAFFVKNLSYVFETGRKSVMELLGAIITKFNDEIIEEYADMLFVALVLVIANDESAKCREMAAHLVKTLLDRLHDEQKKTIISHTHSWAAQRDNAALARVSSQVYGLILDALKTDAKPYLGLLLDDVNSVIRTAAASVEYDDEGEHGLSENNWQIPYQALTVLSKVFQQFPDAILDHSKVPWSSVATLLLYPHAWVRTASCRLLGSLFSVTPVRVPVDGLPDDFPLSRIGMRGLANSFSLQLKSENLDEALSLQIVKNLFYIGKCFYAIPAPGRQTAYKDMVSCNDADNVSDVNSDEDEEIPPEPEEDGEKEVLTGDNPLPRLFSRLSYQARSAYITRINKPNETKNWSRQVMAIFQWFAAMASYMDGSRLDRYLPHILAPVYRIAEDGVIRDPQMGELKNLSAELQSLLQSKVGTSTFALIYANIRTRIVSVRRERATARKLQRTVDPKRAAERKLKRNIGKRKREKDERRIQGFKRRRPD